MTLYVPVSLEEWIRSIEIEVPVPDSTPPATFPSAYWSIRNQKPDLSIPEGSISSYYYKMRDLVRKQKWNDDVMAGYLIRYIQTYPGQFETFSPTEWKSNGMVLAKRGEVVNPLSLLYIKGEGKVIMDPEANNDSMKQTRLHNFVSLTLAFCKSLASLHDQTYGTEFVRFMENELKNSNFPVNESISSNFTYCKYPINATTKFKKVLSAIDMFYFRFPGHPAVVLRLGTFLLRHLCCGMLTPVKEISTKLCMTVYELKFFIFSEEIRQELDNFMKPGEIDTDPYSYFPYCVGLGIVTRSPYCSSQNPNLYLWLHTVLCMLGVAESYNASMPQSAMDIFSTIHIAAAVASIAGELNGPLDGTFCPDLPANIERLRQQAAELFNSLKIHNGLSRDQIVFAKSKTYGLGNCPPGSIGLYLHNHFSGF